MSNHDHVRVEQAQRLFFTKYGEIKGVLQLTISSRGRDGNIIPLSYSCQRGLVGNRGRRHFMGSALAGCSWYSLCHPPSYPLCVRAPRYRLMARPRGQDAPSTNEADYDPEAAPLLVHVHEHRRATPLPLLQLLILAAVRLAEPISFSQARLQGSFSIITPMLTPYVP